MKTAELFENTLVPPNVIGIQIGRFYADLAHRVRDALLEKDSETFMTLSLMTNTDQLNLLFYFIPKGEPKLTPPTPGSIIKELKEKYKLGFLKISHWLVKEGEHDWSFDFSVDVSDFSENLNAIATAIEKSFTANIGGIEYTINKAP